MAIEVAKVELKTVQDASGVEERIKAGQFSDPPENPSALGHTSVSKSGHRLTSRLTRR